MPDILKYLLMAIVPIGLIILAMFAFWFVLPVVIIGIAVRMIYVKFFLKKRPAFRTYTFSQSWPKDASFDRERNMVNIREQEFTTVIDADDLDREYQIPKMK